MSPVQITSIRLSFGGESKIQEGRKEIRDRLKIPKVESHNEELRAGEMVVAGIK